MATSNYSWNLPTVGGSEDTWGTSLNANWTALDTLLGGVTQTEFALLSDVPNIAGPRWRDFAVVWLHRQHP
jgi:hypothetical protein